MRSTLRTLAAMALWSATHSLLATFRSKHAAERLLGTERQHGLYRASYNAVAILTLIALAGYLRGLPDREIYRLRGPARLTSGLSRAALLVLMLRAAWEIGLGPFSGLTELGRYLLDHPTPDAPEAQGPVLADDGLRTGGPFAHVRHPLNGGAAAFVLLTPRMTEVRLTVAAATLLYAVIGSKLEERRLLVRYGEPYRRYLQSGVPFLLPKLRPVTTRH